ncbi:hypothetical protein CapIbe_019954 [Capra ibex]
MALVVNNLLASLPCGSVFLPDIWDLHRQACCLVTCAHRSPTWPGAQSAVRDCDETLAKSPANRAVGLPPGDRSLDEGGTRTDRGHVLVPTGARRQRHALQVGHARPRGRRTSAVGQREASSRLNMER